MKRIIIACALFVTTHMHAQLNYGQLIAQHQGLFSYAKIIIYPTIQQGNTCLKMYPFKAPLTQEQLTTVRNWYVNSPKPCGYQRWTLVKNPNNGNCEYDWEENFNQTNTRQMDDSLEAILEEIGAYPGDTPYNNCAFPVTFYILNGNSTSQKKLRQMRKHNKRMKRIAAQHVAAQKLGNTYAMGSTDWKRMVPSIPVTVKN